MSQTEYVPCTLCRTDDYEVQYESNLSDAEPLNPGEFSVGHTQAEHGRVVKCRRCGLLYVNPRDPWEELEANYAQVDPAAYLDEEESRLLSFQRYLRYVEKFHPPGRLLDVGCGAGLFLAVAKRRWEVQGVEVGRELAAYGRERFGVPIWEGTLAEAPFPPNSFDVATMWDVIEHLPDPAQTVEELHRLLRPGGYLFIGTPDAGSLLARLMGERWPMMIRIHLFYFSRSSLRALLEAQDFRVVEVGSYGRLFTLGYLAKRLKPFSPRLARAADILVSRLLRCGRIRIPVNLGDCMLMVAQKPGEGGWPAAGGSLRRQVGGA